MSLKVIKDKLIVYTDGGSRGNPGPAAIGVIIKNKAGAIINGYGETVGRATNNEAEYRAVIFALKKIKSLFGKEKTKHTSLEIRLDSELVAKQLGGEYRVEEQSLHPFFMEIWNLKIDFGQIIFKNVPREENKEADKMVNEALDREQTKIF